IRYGQHAMPLFLDALKDSKAEVRIAAAGTLGKIADWQFGPTKAFRRLEEEDAAFPVRPEPAVAALGDVLLKVKSPSVREVAVTSLGRIGYAAVPTLVNVVQSGDDEVRKLAIP